MKKLLLGLSIAALAFTSMQDSYAGLFSSKTPEQKAEEREAKAEKKAREANLKAMKTCIADLVNQTEKLIKAFNAFLDTLQDTATAKDSSPKSAESIKKVLLIERAFSNIVGMLRCCQAAVANLERGLKEKDGSEAQNSYFAQALTVIRNISGTKANFGIDIVSMVDLTKQDSDTIYNADKIQKGLSKLDEKVRGTGKKNDVGLSTSWESAANKSEDQSYAYHSLDKDEAMEMDDEEIGQYPACALITGIDIECIRKVLLDFYPELVAFTKDICNGKKNDASKLMKVLRQTLRLKGLVASGELEYREREEKVKKSRRQATSKKTKAEDFDDEEDEEEEFVERKKPTKKKATKSKEFEDIYDEELDEEYKEFFESKRKESASKRATKAAKKSNRSKLRMDEEEEEFVERKKPTKKKVTKAKEFEDIDDE